MSEKFPVSWSKDLKSRILVDEDASKYTTFGIGGRVPLWIELFDLEESVRVIEGLRQERSKFFVIGRGSNLLISDEKIDKVFLSLQSDYFKKAAIEGDELRARAGLTLDALISKASKHSLGGLEFLAGIPGSLGGALYMNAGVRDKCIGDLVKEVKVVTCQGAVKVLRQDELSFSYRDGGLKECVIVEAVLRLNKTKKEDILAARRRFLEDRKKRQPLDCASAGCIFKNPPGEGNESGRLIEKAGLKGFGIGDARISSKHANFIVNGGRATFNDVCRLISYVQDKINRLYGVKLETEIEIVQADERKEKF